MMPVDRCICHQISFAEVKEIAREKGYTTVKELRVENICSTNCRLCEPYIQQVLETGETIFQPDFSKRMTE